MIRGLNIVTIAMLLNISTFSQLLGKKGLIITDSSEYSLALIKAWERCHYMNEEVEFRKGSLFILSNWDLFLHQLLPRNYLPALLQSSNVKPCRCRYIQSVFANM
ncbi:hypothetical protein BH09BAC1_BH09BAC1_24400 [soil metagenome]